MRCAVRSVALGASGLSAAAVAQMVHLRVNFDPFLCQDPPGTRHGCAGRGLPGRPLRLLFVGDSMCVGVGSMTPASLQAACAQQLSETRGRPVLWHTIAKTGADVRTLHAMLEANDDSLGSRDEAFDAAIIVCGVNDGKKFWSEFRTPCVFRRDLEELCLKLCSNWPGCKIVVPSLPGYQCCPLLQAWPACHLISIFFQSFEVQKELLAETGGWQCPSPPDSLLPTPKESWLWSPDGVHPSFQGYQKLGRWLGAAVQIGSREAHFGIE